MPKKKIHLKNRLSIEPQLRQIQVIPDMTAGVDCDQHSFVIGSKIIGIEIIVASENESGKFALVAFPL